MTWFVVSIVSVIQFAEGEIQNDFPVFEDFYLFCASSDEELQEKIAKEMKGINLAGDVFYKNKKAVQRCLGVRKIRSIYNVETPGDIDTLPPSNGSELSHSFYIANSLDDAYKLAAGKALNIFYVDDDEFDEDEHEGGQL